jgi:hypothetical protein
VSSLGGPPKRSLVRLSARAAAVVLGVSILPGALWGGGAVLGPTLQPEACNVDIFLDCASFALSSRVLLTLVFPLVLAATLVVGVASALVSAYLCVRPRPLSAAFASALLIWILVFWVTTPDLLRRL